MKERISALFDKLAKGKFGFLVQFVKFGLVGVSNTLISYGIEMLCFYGLFAGRSFSGITGWLAGLGITADGNTVKIVLTTALAFVISTLNSYFWNNRYVFADGKKKTFGQHARAYFKTVLCYGITGLILSPVIKVWLGNNGVPYWLAALGSLIITIPLNYVMNKFWAFGKKSDDRKETGS